MLPLLDDSQFVNYIIKIPNNILSQYLTPIELVQLARTSSTVYKWCDLLNNSYWFMCLLEEKRKDLKPAEAATKFFAEPSSRLPQYIYYGDLGLLHLDTHLRQAQIPSSKIIQYKKLMLHNTISIADAILLMKMLSPEITIEVIETLLSQTTAINKITHHISIIYLKSLYQREAYAYYKTVSSSLSCFLLAVLLDKKSHSYKQQLVVALDAYAGNIPYPPNKASSLGFPDYCHVMESSYDISNCHQLSDLNSSIFRTDFFSSLLLIGGGVCFMMLSLRFYLHSFVDAAYIQPRILMRYLLPACFVRLLPLTTVTQALLPALPLPIIDSYNTILRLTESESSFFSLMFVLTLSGSLVGAFGLSAIYLASLTQYSVNKIIELNCYIPYFNLTNATYAKDFPWQQCLKGDFTNINYVFKPTLGIQAFCQKLCEANDNWPHLTYVAPLAPLILIGLLFVFEVVNARTSKIIQEILRGGGGKEKQEISTFASLLDPAKLIEQRAIDDCTTLPQGDFDVERGYSYPEFSVFFPCHHIPNVSNAPTGKVKYG